MPAFADYRINPFTNTIETVAITNELHTIPLASPFWIRLREVPQKTTPSTVSIRVTDYLAAAILTTGQTTCTVQNGSWFAINNVITIDAEQMLVTLVSSNTLTITRGYNGTTASTHSAGAQVFIESSMAEVSATPGVGQFWPDYSTGADGNTNWNTGLVLFHSSASGKKVSVNYDGMGTFADKRIVDRGIVSYAAAGLYTFTVPALITQVFVTLIGGGGGGGGACQALGPTPTVWEVGGAGGVGYLFYRLPLGVTPNASIPVVVGNGGRGGASASADTSYVSIPLYAESGETGGSSSFGSYVALGGQGGGGGYNNYGHNPTYGYGPGANGDGGYGYVFGSGSGGQGGLDGGGLNGAAGRVVIEW